MFPSDRTGLRARLRDAVDLLVDFATLGEYRLPASPPWPAPEEAGPGAAGRPLEERGRTAPAPGAGPGNRMPRGYVVARESAGRGPAGARPQRQRRSRTRCGAAPAAPVPCVGRR